LEAPPGLDRGTDDDELGAALAGHARNGLAEASRPGADDLPPHADAVRGRDGGRGFEPSLQRDELAVELRVQRQLAVDDERSDEDDPGTAIGGETAGEIERVLRLLPLEQRHDDGAVGNRAGPAREAARAPMEPPDIRQPPLHRMR
jgi:hypothetical protein